MSDNKSSDHTNRSDHKKRHDHKKRPDYKKRWKTPSNYSVQKNESVQPINNNTPPFLPKENMSNNQSYLPVNGNPYNRNGNDSFTTEMINNLEHKLSKAFYTIDTLNQNMINLEWVLYNRLNDRDRKMQMIEKTLQDVSSNSQLNEHKREDSKKSRTTVTGSPIKRVMRTNKPQDKTQNSMINLQGAISNDMIPMMIIGNMLGNQEEPSKNDSSFEEIKIPDLKKNIRTTVELNSLDNFIELNLKNLDEIANKGNEFIQLIEQHNQDNKLRSTDSPNTNSPNTEPSSNTNCENKDNDLLEQTDKMYGENPLEGILKLIKIISKNDTKHICESKNEKKHQTDPNHMTINDMIKVDNDNLFTFFGKRYSVDPRKLMRLVRPIEMLNSMIGMKGVKKSVYNFVSHFLQNNHSTSMLNTAIYGKPGVGKTDLGKILCMIYSALEIVPSERFKLVRASDLIGKYVGETRQKTKKILDEAEGGVLFIDEAYSLMSGAGDRYSFGKECIDTLNQELSENRRKLVCIIAGYEQEIQKAFFGSNPGLERRFPFRYTLKDYTDEQMKDIMIRMIRLENIMIDTSVDDQDIKILFKDRKYFGNSGGDIENLLTKCKFANNIRSLGKHPMIRNVLTLADFEEGLRLFKIHKKIDDSTIYKNMFI